MCISIFLKIGISILSKTLKRQYKKNLPNSIFLYITKKIETWCFRMLQEDRELFQLYKDLVVSGIVTADEFWASRSGVSSILLQLVHVFHIVTYISCSPPFIRSVKLDQV